MCSSSVDKMDALLSLYRTCIRSKKYYMKFYFHFMDLCAINAWLIYRRDCSDCNIPKKKVLSLFEFKLDLAELLCWSGKRGRKRLSDSLVVPRKISKQVRPNDDIKKDKYNHWPEFGKKNRCKNIINSNSCQALTHIICSKCEINLCFVSTRNCFKNFHQ